MEFNQTFRTAQLTVWEYDIDDIETDDTDAIQS